MAFLLAIMIQVQYKIVPKISYDVTVVVSGADWNSSLPNMPFRLSFALYFMFLGRVLKR